MFNSKNTTYLVILFSFVLFIAMLLICPFFKWDAIFTGYDYYAYIVLAKNIFNHLNFTVSVDTDCPVQYPPLFSILIYSLNYSTNDFVTAIQWINVFSVSFCLIPLFLLVRGILNAVSALLVVMFTVCYFGVDPCKMLFSDYFFCFMIISTCWFIWDALFNNKWKVMRFLGAGVLIGLAYLTKYTGITLAFISVVSILYYFKYHRYDLRIALKLIGALLLGFAMIFISYQLLLSNCTKGRQIPNVATYTFYDGNYSFQGGNELRNKEMFAIDSNGSRFIYNDFLLTHPILDFSYKNPGFLIKKYAHSMQVIVSNPLIYLLEIPDQGNKLFDFKVASFVFVIFFIFPIIVSGILMRWIPSIVHLQLFTIIILFTPFFYHSFRYMIPFLSLYIVTWLVVFYSVYLYLDQKMMKKRMLFFKSFSILIVLCFLIFCFMKWEKNPYWHGATSHKQELAVVSFLKNDLKGRIKPRSIMASQAFWSYMTDTEHMVFPGTHDWMVIMNFAMVKHIDYIVIGEDVFSKMFNTNWVPKGMTVTRQMPGQYYWLVYKLSY